MDKTVIEKYLNEQKVKAVEKFDFAKSTISYTKDIKQTREIKKITGDEEVVRAYILTKLVNILGYKPENIEIEKEYDIGRPKVNKPRIDVVVRDKDGNAFLYMELKSPEDYEKDKDEVIEKQLFNLASQEKGQGVDVKYLVLYSFDIVNGEIKDDPLVKSHPKQAKACLVCLA